MPHKSTEAYPVVRPISIDDLRFVNEYEARLFQSPGHIDAYQAVHPGCKRSSAAISAYRLLAKDSVKREIQLRLEATKSVNPASLGACLHKYRQWAEDKQDYEAASNIVMNQAKLAGLLVDKREDVTPPTPAHTGSRITELMQQVTN